MKPRVPVVATILVAIAIVVMIGLGFWQIRRSHENERLLAQYSAAAKLPPIAYPTGAVKGPLPLFRWATGFCQSVVSGREIAGRSRSGEVGWSHIVNCATGAEGPGMSVEVGWSRDPDAKVNWRGGPVSGVIVPDRENRIRLVAASAPPGLQAAGLPTPETAVPVTPGRNRMYALQWFAFAAIALLIYGLALRNRLKEQR